MKKLFALIVSFSIAFAAPYMLDKAHTEVGFSVKHLMITNVKGNFNDYKASVDFDAEKMHFNALKATIKTASIDTKNEKRDEHLRSEDFFDATNYPEMVFEMKSYEGDANGGKMTGDLTIRGTTKEIVLDVEIGGIATFMEQTKLGFALTGTINRKDFGLNWNKVLETGGFAVDDMVKIVVDVQVIEIQ